MARTGLSPRYTSAQASIRLPAFRLNHELGRIYNDASQQRAELMTSADTPVLRAASPTDAETIAQFNCAMALETENKTLDPSRVRDGVQAVIDQPARGFYLLAERHDEVLGGLMVTFEWSDWRNADFWWIQSVYVRPQARRQGIYAALYREIEARARAAGACGLRLYVENDNHNAMATYVRLGMVDAHYRVMEQNFS